MGKPGGRRALGTGEINLTMITWQGRTQSVKQWAAEMNINVQALLERYRKLERGTAGYTLERVMDPHPMQRGWLPGGMRKRVAVRAEMLAAFDVPYWADDWAWYVVAHHQGDGITLDEIGQLYGVTRERIRQYEVSAMRKIEKTAANGAEIVALLRELDSERKVDTNRFEECEILDMGDYRRTKAKAARDKQARERRRVAGSSTGG